MKAQMRVLALAAYVVFAGAAAAPQQSDVAASAAARCSGCYISLEDCNNDYGRQTCSSWWVCEENHWCCGGGMVYGWCD